MRKKIFQLALSTNRESAVTLAWISAHYLLLRVGCARSGALKEEDYTNRNTDVCSLIKQITHWATQSVSSFPAPVPLFFILFKEGRVLFIKERWHQSTIMRTLRNIGSFHHISSPTEVNKALCALLFAILGTWHYVFLFWIVEVYLNYAHSINILSKDFFVFILTLTIYSYVINSMNASE